LGLASGGIAGMLGEPTYSDDNHRVPYKDAKLVDPGYFMFQEPTEDRPSRYEYNPGDSRVKREMERLKKELIEAGIIERKIFSEADRMPASNPYFLEFMEEENLGTGAGEATPEEYEEQEKVLRSKQEVKDGGRVPFSGGKGVLKGLAKLMDEFFPGTTKLGQTSKPMAEKTQLRKAIADFQERQKNKIIDHSGDLEKAGEGRFTKAEAIIMRLENTIKGSKGKKDKESKYVLETFPNFIKEIKAKPELANNQNVWDNLMGDLPKDQQFVIYGDDTVDFFTQSKFGPHNIASKKAFHQKHPYLTEEEAIKISTMEPNDQVMELKRLEILRRTKNALGGLAHMVGE